VSNGGRVLNNGAYFGTSFSASSNMAVVTGSGSVWSNGFVSLGDDGSRSRVVVSNGGTLQSGSGSIGSIEVIAVAVPQFTSISLSGTNVTITGTNGPANATYAVLTATNVALPLSTWISIATNQFDSGGDFSFTDRIDPGTPQRFYRLRRP
jgi:hypothetical protein